MSKGHNRVVVNNDPTCHGEIDAIRKACRNLKTFDLSGCEIYTTGYHCPMCLCAILWANIDKVYYGIQQIRKLLGLGTRLLKKAFRQGN